MLTFTLMPTSISHLKSSFTFHNLIFIARTLFLSVLFLVLLWLLLVSLALFPTLLPQFLLDFKVLGDDVHSAR